MTTKPAAAKVVHIAAEDVSVGETLRQVLEDMDVAIALSHEGTEGLAAVKATQPEVIVLATRPGDSAPEYTGWYKCAAPRARLVGFALSDKQEREYREMGVDAVANVHEGRAKLMRLLQSG